MLPTKSRTAALTFSSIARLAKRGSGHLARGLKIINVSETLGGIESAARSAVPVLEKTSSTSGSLATAPSTSSCIRVDCSMPVPGMRIACMAMSPSSSCGTNTCPKFANKTPAPSSIAAAAPSTTPRWRRAISSTGAYPRRAVRMSALSLSATRPRMVNATIAGTNVSDNTNAPASAKITVSAIG